jgi:hypothetical protein
MTQSLETKKATTEHIEGWTNRPTVLPFSANAQSSDNSRRTRFRRVVSADCLLPCLLVYLFQRLAHKHYEYYCAHCFPWGRGLQEDEGLLNTWKSRSSFLMERLQAVNDCQLSSVMKTILTSMWLIFYIVFKAKIRP